MGEARRKRLENRAKILADNEMGTLHIDFNKVEQRLVDQGHKPDYLEPKTDDVLIVTHPVSNNPRDFVFVDPPRGHAQRLIDDIEDKPHTKTYTPAAEWRERGEPDPHAGRYDNKERHEIMGGQYTDDEIAFKCGMASGRDLESISVLHLAKDRIRWLSRKLVAAEKRIAELEGKNEA